MTASYNFDVRLNPLIAVGVGANPRTPETFSLDNGDIYAVAGNGNEWGCCVVKKLWSFLRVLFGGLPDDFDGREG
jgi:hypothetical protein